MSVRSVLGSETVRGLTLNVLPALEQLFSATTVIPREEDRIQRNVQRAGGVLATSLLLSFLFSSEDYSVSEIFSSGLGIAAAFGVLEMIVWRLRIAAIDRAYHGK